MRSQQDPSDPEKRNSLLRILRESGEYMTLGLQLAITVSVFTYAGYWLDKNNDSSPWFLLLGVFIGTTGSLIKVIRLTIHSDKQRKKAPKNGV